MGMGYGILSFLIPWSALIILALLLGISFAGAYLGKVVFKIRRKDIANRKGSLVPTVLILWGFSAAAMYISVFTMLAISSAIPYFNGVHSEWGFAHENAYGPAAVYIACWMLLYAILQIPGFFVVKRMLLRRRGAIVVWHLAFTTMIMALLIYRICGFL